MDGRFLLLTGAALIGGSWLIGTMGTGDETGPDPVVQAHAGLAAELAAAGRDLSDPGAYLVAMKEGVSVAGPVAATEHGAPAFIEAVVAGYARPDPAELPGRVGEIAATDGCAPARPASGSRIAHVESGLPVASVSFHAWRADELDPAVADRVETVSLETGGVLDFLAELAGTGGAAPEPTDPWRYRLMDVAISEAAAPVHLVLEAGSERVLWNIHSSAGVELSGVTLLGGTLPAIANLPNAVPVDILDATALAECGLVQAHAPRANDPIFDLVATGRLPVETARGQLQARAETAAAWDAWFTAQFGIGADALRIGHAQGGQLALVGPIPAQPLLRVPYRGLAGAQVAVLAGTATLIAMPEAADDEMGQLVEDLARVTKAEQEAEQIAQVVE
ncbi:hypothetical protein R3X27_08895 [Tropicimonas sp. TH_r6]|uniref:hypothetical protein n=1 Tax=Tropicimonas sp. TH_r6 TaxID=3082085 RepID=UPI0029530EE3|nr:hypothetical protein [Tropicimonas sp. TH_r6]MDV7142799.1 hypothetical protein [Tropicimonas sp. TH_r6]